MTSAKLRNELEELLDYWAKIEGKVKDAEHLAQGVIVPAINELRYAGRRLLMVASIVSQKTISKEQTQRIKEELIKARQYLQNADHDVSDGILTYMNQLREYADSEIGHEVIVKYFNDYTVLKKRLKEGISATIEARSNLAERPEIYKGVYETAISELRLMHDDFLQALAKGKREFLLAQRNAQMERIASRIVRAIQVSVGFIALIAAVFTIITTGPTDLLNGMSGWLGTINTGMPSN